MESPRANHFGNPLVTASVGNRSINHKAPPSPVGSTVSTNDLFNSKKGHSMHSIENLYLSFGPQQHQQHHYDRKHVTCQRQGVSPNSSFEKERDDSCLSQSTVTTAGSTIGLPSHYPGSTNHHRTSSLDSSVLMEELQDFDDIFEQGQASSCQNSLAHSSDEDQHESLTARMNSLDYDDDDDLKALSRPLPTRFGFRHGRNISDLSALSLSTKTPATETEKSRRRKRISSLSSSSSSNDSSTSSPRPSLSSTSIGRHRRSRNHAFSSTDFQNIVLDEL